MLTPRLPLIALALLVVPLALSGCSIAKTNSASGSSASGSSGSTSSSAGSSTSFKRPTDLCDLLSAAEATTVMGATITSTSLNQGHQCEYNGDAVVIRTELGPVSDASVSDLAKLFETDFGASTPVSGVGDEAEGSARALIFRKGSDILSLEVMDGTTTEDRLVALAQVMLSHLG